MSKEAFLYTLRERISNLPQEDIEERIAFYREMIDDRIEEGMSEEDAVDAVGDVNQIAEQIMSEYPLSKLIMKKANPSGKKIGAFTLILLILGFPVWFPLLITAVVLYIVFHIVLWSLLLSLYAVDFSAGIATVVMIPFSIHYLILGNISGAAFAVGAGMFLAGVAILLFFINKLIARGLFGMIKGFVHGIKKSFIRREDSDNAYAQ